MIELGMVICLTLMGVYFFKSADLPKELKEQSARRATEIGSVQSLKPKMTFPKVQTNTVGPADENELREAKLLALKEEKKLKETAKLQLEIDQLTLEITSLEQQIKDNNAKNAEIQNQINLRLSTLSELQTKFASLT